MDLGEVRALEAEVARLREQLDAMSIQREAERRSAAAEQARLTYELGHRVRNTLSVVQALASQTLRGTIPRDEALDVFGRRILALARANDVVLEQSWTSAGIRSIAESILKPLEIGAERLTIEGPETRIGAGAALSLAMALSELASNARRYGAWSEAEGRVRLAWHIETRDETSGLTMVWAETGGPAAAVPAKRGFGLKLIEQSLRSAFGRDITIDFATTGLVCTVRAPLSQLAP